MSNYVKLAAAAGDQYLTALAESQELFLKSVAAVRTPAPPVAVPPAVAGVFPTPQEVAEASFQFAQKLLKQQKEFTEKLLAASMPGPSSAS